MNFFSFSFKSDLFNVYEDDLTTNAVEKRYEIAYKIVKIRCDNKKMRGAKKRENLMKMNLILSCWR